MIFIGEKPPEEVLFGKKPVEPVVDLSKKDEPTMLRNGLIENTLRINRILLKMPCEVELLRVESPSVIWVRLTNHITDTQLTIKEPYNLKRLETIQIGDYAFVPVSERTFGRCRIIAIDPHNHRQVEVFLIDVGRKLLVNISCLCVMEEYFAFFPWQALKISLNGSRPRSVHDVCTKKNRTWSEDECIEFGSLLADFSKLKIVPVFSTIINNDYENPIVADIYGIEENSEVSVLEIFNSINSINGFNSNDLLDSSKHTVYEISTKPANVKVDPIHTAIPSDWVRFTSEEEEENERERNANPESPHRSNPDWDDCQVEPFTERTLDSYRDPETKEVYISVEGAYTKSPNLWYARPIYRQWIMPGDENAKTWKDGLDKRNGAEPILLDTSEWVIEGNKRLLQFAEKLDSFYSSTKNRKPLKQDHINQQLRSKKKVYGICAVNEERSAYTGEWQRVQVLESSTFARVRFLDTGGEDIVLQSSIYQIHRQHCDQPPLCVQFSLTKLKPQSPEGWSENEVKIFKTCLREDKPLMVRGLEVFPINPIEYVSVQDVLGCVTGSKLTSIVAAFQIQL